MNAEITNASVARAANPAVGDIAIKIAIAARAMGLVCHPRNYEILHGVFTGSNAALTAEFAALGSRPRQEDLDRLSFRYFAQAGNHLLMENIREEIATRVVEVATLIGNERAHLERFGAILNETSESLAMRTGIGREVVDRIARMVSTATDSKLEQGRQLAGTFTEKSAEIREVRARLEEFKRLADTDPLTRLKNRRIFDVALARVYEGQRPRSGAALLIADIDHFKIINDRFGHPVGDRILRDVANMLDETIPEPAIVARIGGEEFAAILEGTTSDAALELAEIIRQAMKSVTAKHARLLVGGAVTLSLGVCMADRAAGPEALYAAADQALYAAKAAGRDRCVAA
jgi:diguanylate cyclase